MATNRTPSSNTYWSLITSLVDGDLVTMQRLYSEAIHRLQDNVHYVLGKVAQVYADLASTAAGGHAFSVGNVNVTAFDFQSGAALNGLTIIVDEDTTTAQTCTFDNSITSPALLLAALTSQAGANLTWSLTSDGFLRVQSNTEGSGSTLAAPTGTAATALFGSATTTSPGSASVADGTTKIGFAGYTSGSVNVAAGTLRNALEEIVFMLGTGIPSLTSQTNPDGTTNIGFSGFATGTINILAGTLRNSLEAIVEQIDVRQRRQRATADYTATDGDQSVSGDAGADELVFCVVAAAADRSYTLAAPAGIGLIKRVVRDSGGTNDVTLIGALGNATSVVFPAATTHGVTLASSATEWFVVSEYP